MKKTLKTCSLFLVVILVFSLTACLNPLSGESGGKGKTGKITFKLAGSGASSVSRALVDITALEYQSFDHQLTLYKEDGASEGRFKI